MYFWDIRSLVRTLGERDLDEREVFPYFFADTVLMTAVSEIPSENWNAWDTTGAVLTVAITALGVLYCFRANGGAAGQAFLQRFYAVSWVVVIRTLAVSLPVLVAVAALAELTGILTEATAWWEVIMFVAIQVAIYLRVAAHLRTVNALRRQYAGWRERTGAAASEPVAE